MQPTGLCSELIMVALLITASCYCTLKWDFVVQAGPHEWSIFRDSLAILIQKASKHLAPRSHESENMKLNTRFCSELDRPSQTKTDVFIYIVQTFLDPPHRILQDW